MCRQVTRLRDQIYKHGPGVTMKVIESLVLDLSHLFYNTWVAISMYCAIKLLLRIEKAVGKGQPLEHSINDDAIQTMFQYSLQCN